jgi:hypothetical protein
MLESATGPQKAVATETEGTLSPAFWAFLTAFRPHTALHLTASSVRSCVALLKPAFHSGARLMPVFLVPTPAYWITSSARRSSDGGIVIPSAWAVFKLMTSSNFVGCSTGKSAGLAPFRILSTYVAARRNWSGGLAP